MTQRSLAYLIEAEMDKASIIFAARDITNKLQQMAEQLATMVAKEVMPLGDAARDVFGAEQAATFEKAISDKINALLDQVRETKNGISDQLDGLENGSPVSDLANTGSSDEMFGGTGEIAGNDLGGDAGDDAFAPEAGAEGGMGDGAEMDLSDIFSGAEEESNAAGRMTKESRQPKAAVLEASSADYQLTREFAGLLREGKKVAEALNIVAESYAIDAATVAEIVTAVKAAKKA